MIEAVRSGRLNLGQIKGGQGYGSFVVRKEDANQLATALLGDSRRDTPALPGVMSALEFSVLVRLNKSGDLLGLLGDGHSPSFQILHPVTKRPQLRLDETQIQNFHAKFVTVETISNALGLPNRRVQGALKSFRVPIFEANGKSYGPIYLRKEARRAFPMLPATPLI